MEWQPIETAPNGVSILLSCKSNNSNRYTCVGQYVERFCMQAGYDNDNSEYSEKDDEYTVLPGWYENQYNWNEFSSIAIMDSVTHWMSLPPPPTE